jgi:two-component system, chemotaxis family, chemotaxis protein CheY
MNILLVDDSKTMRNIQKKVLAGVWPAATFAEAGDGLEALTQIAANGATPFSLILIDWNMPNMDGLTLVGKIREKDKKTPLVMVTTEAEKTRVVDAIKAGVNNYVIKPFTPETLMEKINATLARLAGAQPQAAAA